MNGRQKKDNWLLIKMKDQKRDRKLARASEPGSPIR
jgi:hypothetical protein